MLLARRRLRSRSAREQPFAGRDDVGDHDVAHAAVGRNPVSWLIPCHRVITSLGGPGGYRWGIDTKLAMIAFEATRQPSRQAA
jgi:hypothetical protein